jgi:hypothetical protein
MSEDFYRDACDALVGFLPAELAAFEHRAHGRGLKVWFGEVHREHYELQEVGMIERDGRDVLERGLEIGFHAEHRDPAANERALAVLLGGEKRWRARLGAAAHAGPFVNDQQRGWRRISEFWTGEEIDEPDTAIEAADRLACYIAAFEPLRRAAGEQSARAPAKTPAKAGAKTPAKTPAKTAGKTPAKAPRTAPAHAPGQARAAR